jgi:hypothetical protein
VVKTQLFRAGALLLPALAAACGTGTAVMEGAPPPSPRAAVLASMQQVQGTSYRFTMRLTMTGFGSAMGGDASAYAFSESGAYSAGQRALDATVTSPLLKSAKLGSGIREIVFLGTRTVYVSIGSGAGAGKWYEVTSSGAGAAGFGALLGSLDEDSPLGYVGTVNGALTGARRVGTATIDGVTTTEYAVTENLRKVLGKLVSSGFAGQIAKSFAGGSPVDGQAFSKGLTAALKSMPQDLTFQAYLDAGGHLRRLSLGVPIGAMFTAVFSGLGLASGDLSLLTGTFGHVLEHVTMDLSDYGASVHIAPPPASEVVKGLPPGASGSSSVSSSASAAAGASGSTVAGGSTGALGSIGVTGQITTP